MPDFSRLSIEVSFEEFLAAVEEDEEAPMSIITQYRSRVSDTGDLQAEVVYYLVPGKDVGVFFRMMRTPRHYLAALWQEIPAERSRLSQT